MRVIISTSINKRCYSCPNYSNIKSIKVIKVKYWITKSFEKTTLLCKSQLPTDATHCCFPLQKVSRIGDFYFGFSRFHSFFFLSNSLIILLKSQFWLPYTPSLHDFFFLSFLSLSLISFFTGPNFFCLLPFYAYLTDMEFMQRLDGALRCFFSWTNNM